ncbi:L-dopachrome tautomerase-related protein [Bradyrhizobium sp. BR 10289]|uniref:L-dopachrome tautomerase-related protein n=1 Tax=Bradyrhizobium sp. BR 10289 TaxID=2749993 RepID=UPI001C64CCA6|nr:L-dopachrome tautomerase-related protein [Bradyrhizobium sp. BR 10289]MBW7970669.1 gluconolactonase [Bradyrhizobium sp. BR 10289]
MRPNLFGSCAAVFLSISSAAHAQTATEDIKAKAERLVSPLTDARDSRLQVVATFDHQVTGVTVAPDGRIFVNFPRWTEDTPVSVAELLPDGSIKPYPSEEWNSWRNAKMSDVSPNDHFVCVQSVVADQRGSLWVVDPAAPNAEKTIKGGPKIVEIDLKSNNVKRSFPLPPEIAGPASYLNDIRIAPDGKFAYLTDSGSPGGLVVLNIGSGQAWRVLSDDPSTQFDPSVSVMTDGQPLRRPDGRQPLFNADSLALSKDGSTLYWQALTGKTLYRIATSSIQNPDTAGRARPETVATTEPADGLWTGENDEIYLSSLANNAVKVINSKDGSIRQLLTDSRLRWPDTFSQGPDGHVYVTASHIQDSPWFHMAWTDKTFTLFKFMLRDANAVASDGASKPK